jgi:hypothetical protein
MLAVPKDCCCQSGIVRYGAFFFCCYNARRFVLSIFYSDTEGWLR